jgi:hypothetical protein
MGYVFRRSTLLSGRERRSPASWMDTIDMRGDAGGERVEEGVEECTKGTNRWRGALLLLRWLSTRRLKLFVSTSCGMEQKETWTHNQS